MIMHIMHIEYILHILHVVHIGSISLAYDLIYFYTAWVDICQSTIVYERKEAAQVLYIIPVSSILGFLSLVSVGKTGTNSSTCEESQKIF